MICCFACHLCVTVGVSVCVCKYFKGNALHSRYADLKQVVLDELLAQHGDAQLDAQLHEAAGMRALGREEEKNKEGHDQSEAGEHERTVTSDTAVLYQDTNIFWEAQDYSGFYI